MKLSDALCEAYNTQIQLEFESAFVYLQMGADFEHRNMTGFATWMRTQAAEEQTHAMKFLDFVLDRGGAISLKGVPSSPATPTTALGAFEVARRHEERVSKAISDLYAAALKEQDFASLPLLQWFVNEQIEEESTVSQIVERLRMVGNDGTGLLFMDRELGGRPVESADTAE